MIIAKVTSTPVVTSLSSAPASFRIKASARAFKILSGFYSDPLLAIPRELGANAWDSHVKAGKTDTMFDVHAPNHLEPWFSIRDFGTGLSRESIEQIYTTYFESTKTTDNDSDGCMGLGSKTPFNYTENFSVTSYFGGEKHVYNCFIDGNGVPSILHFDTENSTEPNGVEVKFAVKAGDINMFVDKIRSAYAPFRFKPVIKGAVINYPEITHLFKGNSWAVRKNGNESRYGDEGGSFAYMGNYSYPINVNSLFSGDRYAHKNYDKVMAILNYGHAELYFNIGDLEVAPNKEQLQYDADQKTQKAIIAAALKAHAELTDQIQKSIEKPSTLWEAMLIYRKYNSYDSPFYKLTKIIGDIPVSFNGKNIQTSEIDIRTMHDDTGLSAKVPAGTEFSAKYGHFKIEIYQYRTHTGQLRNTRENRYHAGDKEGAIFFVTNSDSLKRSRLRYHLLTKYPNGNYPTIHVIHDHTGNVVWEAHKKHLGLSDSIVFDIETLPKPPAKPRSPSTAKTNEIHTFPLGQVTSRHWTTAELEADSKGTYYYIDYFYSDPTYKDKPIGGDVVHAAVQYGISNKLFGSAPALYGINRKNKFMLKTGKWINFMSLVEKAIEKDSTDLAHELYIIEVYEPKVSANQNLRHKINRSHFIEFLDRKTTRDLFEKFTEAFNSGRTEKTNLYSVLGRHFAIKAKKNPTFDDTLVNLGNTINDKYMNIFDMIDTYSTDSKKLARIINFIDKNS